MLVKYFRKPEVLRTVAGLPCFIASWDTKNLEGCLTKARQWFHWVQWIKTPSELSALSHCVFQVRSEMECRSSNPSQLYWVSQWLHLFSWGRAWGMTPWLRDDPLNKNVTPVFNALLSPPQLLYLIRAVWAFWSNFVWRSNRLWDCFEQVLASFNLIFSFWARRATRGFPIFVQHEFHKPDAKSAPFCAQKCWTCLVSSSWTLLNWRDTGSSTSNTPCSVLVSQPLKRSCHHELKDSQNPYWQPFGPICVSPSCSIGSSKRMAQNQRDVLVKWSPWNVIIGMSIH